MLPLFLLLAAWSADGVWPPTGLRQAADSGERRDSVPRATSRARPSPQVLPALWSNDYGGVTLGLRARPMRGRDAERGLFVASAATRGDATSSVSLYGRWRNPFGGSGSRVASSLAVWSVEGRSGAAVTFDRAALRRGDVGADRHVGVAALWMATTNVDYLDRRLWDDAGSFQIGPWISSVARRGETVVQARGAVSLGLVYQHATPQVASGHHYTYRGFSRVTGEVSTRTKLSRATTFGARVFAGALLGSSNPVRQLRIAVAGADPYETFSNPFLRSRGALLVRPDFHYQAPGGGNLRGFRNDLGGRWALGVNLELTRAVVRRNAGFLREGALEAFVDLGVVDTLALPSSPPGQWYTTMYDGGFGIVTRHQVKDLAWTMRFEVPLAVNRWDAAADFRPNSTRFALRWQVSFAPSF
ncbi:MAG: hypothetical protein DMD60_10025 [Gemmatimonadetes bacterium]|nr:MAG: hypothetical protein DMD60_10025 [Gemmatimonadota bacterium]